MKLSLFRNMKCSPDRLLLDPCGNCGKLPGRPFNLVLWKKCGKPVEKLGKNWVKLQTVDRQFPWHCSLGYPRSCDRCFPIFVETRNFASLHFSCPLSPSPPLPLSPSASNIPPRSTRQKNAIVQLTQSIRQIGIFLLLLGNFITTIKDRCMVFSAKCLPNFWQA